MKKHLFCLSTLILALASCQKSEIKEPGNSDGDNGGATGANLVQLWGRTAEGLWTSASEIGVYTSDETNSKFTVNYLPESAAQQDRAYFEGRMTPDCVVFGAYTPYSADAGDNLTRVLTTIPETVQNGDALAQFDVAAYEEDADIKFNFKKKLATVELSFSNVAGSYIENAEITKIEFESVRGIVGTYTADLSQPDLPLSPVNESNRLTINVSREKLTESFVARAAIAARWKGSDQITVSINDGAYVTKVALSKAVEEGSVAKLVIDANQFNPEIKLEWISPALGTEGGLESQARGNCVAVDNKGNAYMQVAKGETKIYKLNAADGSIAWSYNIGFTGDNNSSPSCEPDGSVIYACGGTGGSGRVVALNADGSAKWTFASSDFVGFKDNAPTTPAPNFNCSTPAVGNTHIYVGNAGTTGTVVSINKSTGKRSSYMSNAAGNGGPAGGVMSGVGISSANQVVCMAAYGIFTASKTLMDTPNKTLEGVGGYTPWSQRIWHGWQYNQTRSGFACSNINGQNVIWGNALEQTSAGTYNLRVFWKAVSNDDSLVENYTKQAFGAEANIQNVTAQDQGGIVIGPRGEAIVSLKGTPGSIKAIGTDGKEAYSYVMSKGRDVCGSCAVDNNGYIHIVSDYNNGEGAIYSIVKPNYETKTCEVVASSVLQDLAEGKMGDSNAIRAWTSVTLGNDGKIYLGVSAFTLEGSAWKSQNARVMCLSYQGVTGPNATSPWPQRAADCHHTGVQK